MNIYENNDLGKLLENNAIYREVYESQQEGAKA